MRDATTRGGERPAGWRHAGAAAALAFALFGCAETSRLGIGEPAPSRETTKLTDSVPAQREHARILAAYGGTYQDPRLEGLIGQTVDRLVAASERPDLRYKVTILNSPTVNAFALPNGQLYVSRGLVALANDRSELASVLSHEMAHVIARHATIREDQMKQAVLVSRVATEVFNDPQMSAMALAKNKIALATFSRGQELEADGIGVGISSRAGFDPYGAVRFLSDMGRNAELRPAVGGTDTRLMDFLSSHPATPDRMKVAQANARQYSAPGSGERDRSEYLAALDGLVYGEDPSEGFVRGRRFLHPRLGFTFTAPDGFVLDNTAQAVLGVKEGGGQALRVDVVRVPAEQSLTDYLGSGWIENVEQGSIEELTINGFAAATAAAKGDQWQFRLFAVRFSSTDVYRFIFATKQRTPEADRLFRESVMSFRRMSPNESQAAKPLRLKVVTVTPGDTPERLASRMAVVDRPLERFLVLNGFAAGQGPKPGDQVKLVVE